MFNIGDIRTDKNGLQFECIGKTRISPTLITDKEEYDYTWKAIVGGGAGGSGGEDLLADMLNRTITEYSSNKVINLPDRAFCDCTSLTSVNLPACTSIGDDAFQYCDSLTTVNLPACTSTYYGMFKDCTLLTYANLLACTNIASEAFSGCTSLTSVNFPACTNIEPSAFYGCTSLTSVNLQACEVIDADAFSGCTSLTEIYLLAPSVCTLIGCEAFTDTPIASGTGAIYVPASMVDEYKEYGYWSEFSNVIYPYEETT